MPFHHKSFLDAVMKGLKRQYAKVSEKVVGFTTGQVADMLDLVLQPPTDLLHDSEAARLRLAALFIVCYFCSARDEEALALWFEDISLKDVWQSAFRLSSRMASSLGLSSGRSGLSWTTYGF